MRSLAILLPLLAAPGLLALPLADPAPPTLTYLFTANLTSAPPIAIGAGPLGVRQVMPVSGGTFSGPRLGEGKIPAAGGDWGLVEPKSGAFSPEALYVLQLADGANVLVSGKGHVPHETLLFETGAEKYAWLNTAVAVGRARQVAGGVSIDVFQVG